MVAKKTILLEGVGECTFIKSKRSRKIRIKVEPHKPIVTYLPLYVSYDSAYRFVVSKKEWLKKAKGKISEIENQRTMFTPNTQFSTRFHQLKIEKHNNSKLIARINNGEIKVFCPNLDSVEEEGIQKFIRNAIIETYRMEAKQILPKKLYELASKYGYQYNNVFIKNLKSRWGSCSAKNNINLNLHLIRLPEHLMEYVLLHELVHTVEKNHREKFWNLLNSHVGQAKKLQNEMRNYSIEF